MARPSLKNERKEQILDAFEACVARYGVEGATLERVAEEAGLARTLIRHNVGNKEDLLEALVQRFLTMSTKSMRQMWDALPKDGGTRELVEWLFDPVYSNPTLVLVSEALTTAAANDPSLATKMRNWMRTFITDLENVLVADYPGADEATIEAVASGITGIYFTVDSTSPLGAMSDFRSSSKAAALLLVSALEAKSKA